MILKSRLDELALLGGQPAFAEPVHVGRPNLGDRGRFLARVNDLLDRRWLTNDGPLVREFEQAVTKLLGVKHCVAMCNGTVALEIAIRAADLTGEVLCPSYTFVATAHALQWQQITPVFCDIDPRTHHLDPGQLEKMITPRTSAILATHLWGRPCAVEALSEVARRHRLKLLFDAAHAFGCSHRGKMIGGFGCAEVFSFHATKFFNTFEGGAVTTDDDALAAKMRLMRNFGFAGYDNVIYIGTNGKMTEICAAMGLTGLESLDQFVETNRQNYQQYRRELAGVPGLRLLAYDDAERCNYQYIVAELDEGVMGLSRDQLVAVLQAENVLARKYFWPGCHQMQPYRAHFPHAGLLLPHTLEIARRVVVLPTGTALSPAEITAICQLIRLAVTEAGALRQRWPASAGVATRV